MNDLENSLINFVIIFAKNMFLFSYYNSGHLIDQFPKFKGKNCNKKNKKIDFFKIFKILEIKINLVEQDFEENFS